MRGGFRSGLLPGLLLLPLLALAGGLIYYLGRGTTFFFDEWNFILERRTGGVEAFLNPHGGHLSAVPVLVYRLLWSVVGLRHYGAFRATVIGVHLLCCVLLYLIARRRIGPVAALVPTALLLFLGSAWQDLLWPFQIGYLASLAGGLAMILMLDHPDTRHDLAAAGLLLLSLASSGLGIPFAAAALLGLVLTRRWRQLWMALGPLALFGLWYLAYGRGSTDAQLSNLPRIPIYVARSMAAAAGGLVGLSGRWGAVIAVAGLVGLAAFAVRRRATSLRLLMLIALPLVFWGLTALTRGQLGEPGASRYLYPGGLFLLLITVEVLAGLRLQPWMAVIPVLLVPAIVANVQLLHNGALGLRSVSTTVRAELGAVEIERRYVARDFRPDTQLMPQVTAGPYLAAVDALGSPADPPGAIGATPEPVRASVDSVLERAEGLTLSTNVVGSAPDPNMTVDTSLGATVARGPGGCVSIAATQSLARVELSVRGARLVIAAQHGPVTIWVRRFDRQYPDTPIGAVSPDDQIIPTQARSILFRPDGAPDFWHVALETSAQVSACALLP